ncbi:hypothetical protein ACSFBM_31450 [Variovorax sp. GB1R11]|uniref:hypothetical protein n=1 Tax=Variovorax sp. GB1R11 TaxID=3443741 RepID=UPI003F459F6C
MPARRTTVSPREDLPTADAVQTNKQVAQEVKAAADDLVVVHAVLDKELAEEVRSDDVNQAVAQTAKIEKRLSKSAKALDKVNRKLEDKVSARQAKPKAGRR